MTQIPPAFGQVWGQGDQLALVRTVDHLAHQPGRLVAHMTTIIDGKATGTRFAADVVDGVPTYNGPWQLHQVLPRLRCLSPADARAAARMLEAAGISDVLVDGDHVAAPLQVPISVMKFADDALEHGWASDRECAKMIGRMG